MTSIMQRLVNSIKYKVFIDLLESTPLQAFVAVSTLVAFVINDGQLKTKTII